MKENNKSEKLNISETLLKMKGEKIMEKINVEKIIMEINRGILLKQIDEIDMKFRVHEIDDLIIKIQEIYQNGLDLI